MESKKKVVVSVGPIPARVDSVKFITNRFKGGLAARTAYELAKKGHDVTVIAWQHANIPTDIMAPKPIMVDGKRQEYPGVQSVVRVRDVFEYYDWFVAHANDYDAFVMAAAVANLTPVKPWEGKFPSHLYKPGDEFDIKFMIAPRAIDAIKPLNPKACLIGYKLFDTPDDAELIDIAKHTLSDAKANLIFANRPSDAKDRKIAVLPDDSVIECGFDEHVDLIDRAIRQEYYSTEVSQLTDEESHDPDVREAMATAAMFERTFPGFGTVAVPVKHMDGAFVTTSRGHKSGSPILVRHVNHDTRTIHASGKATLNAPTLAAMLDGRDDAIVIHRHGNDPLYEETSPFDGPGTYAMDAGRYLFPGTYEEAVTIRKMAVDDGAKLIREPNHGYLKLMPILPVDWKLYHRLFPEKYFSTPDVMEAAIKAAAGTKTLELGANESSDAAYAYDPYVTVKDAENLTWGGVMAMTFDMAYARNAINYLTLEQIKAILERTEKFVANTFLAAPKSKVTDDEASVLTDGTIRHTLRLEGDGIMRHSFHAHTRADYESLGLKIEPYGRNSALVSKDLD